MSRKHLVRDTKGHCERRYLFSDTELRVEDVDGKPQVVGYAAVFNEETEIMRRFREKVRPGAFAKTIVESDVRGLFNHDPNYVLGRNRSGTMRLEETSHGLQYRIQAPSSDLIHDLVLEPMRRGDISGSSFSFDVIRQEMSETADGDDVRELVEVRLWDVGPVTFPAYPGTDAEVRSALDACETLDEVAWISCFRAGGLTSPEVRGKTLYQNVSSDDTSSTGESDVSTARASDRLRIAELEM